MSAHAALERKSIQIPTISLTKSKLWGLQANDATACYKKVLFLGYFASFSREPQPRLNAQHRSCRFFVCCTYFPSVLHPLFSWETEETPVPTRAQTPARDWKSPRYAH